MLSLSPSTAASPHGRPSSKTITSATATPPPASSSPTSSGSSSRSSSGLHNIIDDEGGRRMMVDEEEEEDGSSGTDEGSKRSEVKPRSPFDPIRDAPIMDDGQIMDMGDSVQLERDKKAVYTHPLFPLLALLLEKCELATATLSICQEKRTSSSSFNLEIQEFVQHQERDGKPFLSDDPEVDALMIKAIQVLRIHLLELEKVQELCKDFCQRYITCLRTKMNSENLLRGATGISGSGLAFDGSSPSSPEESDDGNPSSSQGLHPGSSFPPLSSSSSNMVATPSAQRIYDLVQGPSGSESLGSGTHERNGSRYSSEARPQVRPDSGNEGDLSDEASGREKKSQKRGILPKQATSVMRSWLFQHIVHPYPTEDEKKSIAAQTNLTLLQVNNWFINARRRILQPMLDSANALNTAKSAPEDKDSKDTENGSGTGNVKSGAGSNKKLKVAHKSSPSFQRFWPESLAAVIQNPAAENK